MKPSRFEFKDGKLKLIGPGPFIIKRAGKTLREAYLAASKRFFPFQGKIPAPEFFTSPQFNTWIELMYDQARNPSSNTRGRSSKMDSPPRRLHDRRGWFNYYGDFTFDSRRFLIPRR